MDFSDVVFYYNVKGCYHQFQELVTFRSDPSSKSPEISNAGTHLSAIEFHSALHDASK